MSTPPSPLPDRNPVAPPPPLTGLLDVSIPVDGARARRTLWTLALGHLTIAVAAIPVALLVGRGVTNYGYAGSTTIIPVVGALVVSGSQLLSCWKICALVRATTDRINIGDIARSLRRSEWSFLLTFTLAGFQWVALFGTYPATALPLLAILIVALALEGAHISWAHRCTSQYGEHGAVAEGAWLPPGTGARMWTVQARSAGLLAILGGVAAILLVVTIVREVNSPAGVSPTTLVQIVAAIAAAAAPLLPIRGVLLVRTAVIGDTAHLPTLRRARAAFVRAGSVAVPLTALVIASMAAAPENPDLALVRSIPTLIALGIVGSFFIELDRFCIGDISKRFRPKA